MKILVGIISFLFSVSVALAQDTDTTTAESDYPSISVILGDYNRVITLVEYANKSFIKYRGMFVENTAMDLAIAVQNTGVKEIHLNSEGGLAYEGYNLGFYFETNNIKVVIEENDRCQSACAFAAVRANDLHIKNDGLYFHTPYPRDISIRQSFLDFKKNNEISMFFMIQYLREVGFGIDFIELLVYESDIDTYVVLPTVEDVEYFKVENYLDSLPTGGRFRIEEM